MKISDVCHTSNLEVRQSYLTGRDIIVNLDLTRFLLSADTWSIDAGRRAIHGVMSHWDRIDYDLRPSAYLATIISHAEKRADLAAVTELMASIFMDVKEWTGETEREAYEKTDWKRRTDRTRIKELLTAFYKESLILFPVDTATFLRKGFVNFEDMGQAGVVCKTWIDAALAKRAHATPAVARIVLRLGGLTSVGDLCPAVLRGCLDPFLTARVSLAKGLLATQRSAHPTGVTHNVDDFGNFGRAALKGRDGRDFGWASKTDSTLADWCALAANYLKTITSSSNAQTPLNSFLHHLLDDPSAPRSAASYTRRDSPKFCVFDHEDPTPHNHVVDFLDWILDTALAEEDDNGEPRRSRSFVNPLSRKIKQTASAETSRQPMPTRFVRMALEILRDNDWEWPRSFGSPIGTAGNADSYTSFDAATGKWKTQWSPVR